MDKIFPTLERATALRPLPSPLFLPRVPGFPRCRSVLAFFDFFTFTAGLDTCDTGLPVPENVALAGAPKIAGCGDGAGRHESPLSHAGGSTGATTHGEPAEQTCASYKL